MLIPTPTTIFRATARLALVPMLWALSPGDAVAGKILATMYTTVAGPSVVEIDPLTGNYTELSPATPPGVTAEFTRSTYDAANNIVYAVKKPTPSAGSMPTPERTRLSPCRISKA